MPAKLKLFCLASLVFAGAAWAEELDEALPDVVELEASGAVIGAIRLDRQNVFDLSIKEENNRLYRLANRWHVLTREDVIRQQLLFRPGEPYSHRLIVESERLLRRNPYFYDASIRVERHADGVVDLVVSTRDVWTLVPGISVSRKGGENRARVSISEQNLMGTGAAIRLSFVDDVDRESTSFQVSDNNLGNTWWSLFARVADNSDGDSQLLILQQPFYALGTRSSKGVNLYLDEA